MRTFEPKQNPHYKPAPCRPARFQTPGSERFHRTDNSLLTQSSIANQTARGMVRPQTEGPGAGLNAAQRLYDREDFSRIPIHPPAAAIQLNPATDRAAIEGEPHTERAANLRLTTSAQAGISGAPEENERLSKPPTISIRAKKIQPKFRLGPANDRYEQEADRVAEQVIRMAEPQSPAGAIRHSTSPFPSPVIHPQGIEPASGGGRGFESVEREKIEGTAATETANAIIQRNPTDDAQSNDRPAPKAGGKKAELEFHSTIAFNNRTSGSSSTGPSTEGFHFFEIQWTVWNSGFETAPAHTDKVTIYHADRCSGCRAENDEFLSMNVQVPATGPISQPGEFRYTAISPTVGTSIRAGHYDTYVELDVNNEVDEINENNNRIFTTFYVKPQDRPEPETDEEEETVQRKEAGAAAVPAPGVEFSSADLKAGGQPLPQSLRDFFEPRFGYDFSRVKIHSDAGAAASAKQLQARAFTIGNDIVFGANQYAFEKPEGRHLLAHELTHVVQQARPTPFHRSRNASVKDET